MAASQGSDVLALAHYLSVVRRGWWIIALTAMLATGAGVLLSLRQDTTFRASAAVFVGASNPAFLFSGIPERNSDPDRYLQNQANIARLPAVAHIAVEDLGISGYAVGDLLSNGSVTVSETSDLLGFSVTDRRPWVAERAATSYARAYSSYKQLIDTRTIAETRKSYEKQIAGLEDVGERGSPRYDELVIQYERLRTLELLQSSSDLTIRAAQGAVRSGPEPTRNAVLACVFGLVLGVGLAFGRDALNTRIRSVDELEGRLGLPLLGRLPEPPRSLRRKNRLVMLESPRSPEAEAFRILATNVELVNLDRGARTVVVTSPLGDEGKSTTVANLAVAFARAGKRVALVDLDLRRPSLDRFFDRPQQSGIGAPGLTHVVLGRATLDQALVSYPVDDLGLQYDSGGNGSRAGALELLLAGPVTPNPAEFVVSRALGDVLEQLGERADIVLIDAAPLLNVSDTVALSSKVDALVLILRSENASTSMLGELQRVLSSARAVKLGFVLTGATGAEGHADAFGYGETPVAASSRKPARRTVA